MSFCFWVTPSQSLELIEREGTCCYFSSWRGRKTFIRSVDVTDFYCNLHVGKGRTRAVISKFQNNFTTLLKNAEIMIPVQPNRRSTRQRPERLSYHAPRSARTDA